MSAAYYIFCVAIGGAGGALFRGFFTAHLNGKFGFPLGTFSANMLASFLTGIAVALQNAGAIPDSAYPLVEVGFCATFSTFSALAWEIAEMLKERRFFAATMYSGGTFTVGLALFAYGEFLAERLAG